MYGKLTTLLIASVVTFGTRAWATDEETAHFSIQDQSPVAAQSWKSPAELMQEGFETFAKAAARLNLLKWVRHEGARPQPAEAYNRKRHFGTWLRERNDGTCYNTRAKVLIRDSQGVVTFRPNNNCVVDSGFWQDPYTGKMLNDARLVQIDHVVALKNAFDSGAWSWNTKKRCLYGNFMKNDFHLRSVDGIENMSKGDSAPDQYIPPNSQFVCSYLEEWLKIKLIWQLKMTQKEAEAIRGYLQQYNCQIKSMSMLQSELAKQRAATVEMQYLCERMANRIEAREAALKVSGDLKDYSAEASFLSDETL